MEKLELKHLVPYYEHNLKVLSTEDNKIYCLTGLSNPYKTVRRDFIKIEIREPLETRSWSFVLNNKEGFTVKPILRPFSDLSKEIEHNGEKFCPEDLLSNLFGDCETFYSFEGVKLIEDTYRTEDAIHSKKIYDNPNYYPWFIIKWLHEHLFDTEGLIEAGLAIDFNTLK